MRHISSIRKALCWALVLFLTSCSSVNVLPVTVDHKPINILENRTIFFALSNTGPETFAELLLSPDGRVAVYDRSMSIKGNIFLDLQKNKRILSDVDADGPIAFSNDGKWIALVNRTSLELRNKTTDSIACVWQKPGSQAERLAFSPDSTKLMVVEDELSVFGVRSILYLYDTISSRLMWKQDLGGIVSAVSFMSGGSEILIGTRSGGLVIHTGKGQLELRDIHSGGRIGNSIMLPGIVRTIVADKLHTRGWCTLGSDSISILPFAIGPQKGLTISGMFPVGVDSAGGLCLFEQRKLLVAYGPSGSAVIDVSKEANTISSIPHQGYQQVVSSLDGRIIGVVEMNGDIEFYRMS